MRADYRHIANAQNANSRTGRLPVLKSNELGDEGSAWIFVAKAQLGLVPGVRRLSAQCPGRLFLLCLATNLRGPSQ